jgi:hypothetical protein
MPEMPMKFIIQSPENDILFKRSGKHYQLIGLIYTALLQEKEFIPRLKNTELIEAMQIVEDSNIVCLP